MIKLTRPRGAADFPADFRPEKLIAKHLELLDLYFQAMKSEKPIAFSSAKWKSAKARLRNDTNKKCAYCEAPTSVVAHGDVEHFRPKSIYWWLAYCFDNYVFACQICNQLYKGDAFPAPGPRLLPPALPLKAPSISSWPDLLPLFLIDPSQATDHICSQKWAIEDADLPHPYLEDPELLFHYEADEINREVWLVANDSERARRALAAAEKVLGLNREDLRQLRYSEFETIAVLKDAFSEKNGLPELTRQRIVAEFARRQKSDFPFAGMHRHFAKLWGIPEP